MSENIRPDHRPRDDGRGGLVNRLPEAWEECHEVLTEFEGAKAGSKAFNAARAAGVSLEQAGKGAGGNGQLTGGLRGRKGDGKARKQENRFRRGWDSTFICMRCFACQPFKKGHDSLSKRPQQNSRMSSFEIFESY